MTDEGAIAGLVRRGRRVRSGRSPFSFSTPRGPQPEAPLEDVGWEDHLAQLDFFVKSPVLLGRAVVPGMRERGWGRIVEIDSEVVDASSSRPLRLCDREERPGRADEELGPRARSARHHRERGFARASSRSSGMRTSRSDVEGRLPRVGSRGSHGLPGRRRARGQPSSPPTPRASSRASASSWTAAAGSESRKKLGGGFSPDDSEDGALGILEDREAADVRHVHRLHDRGAAELPGLFAVVASGSSTATYGCHLARASRRRGCFISPAMPPGSRRGG